MKTTMFKKNTDVYELECSMSGEKVLVKTRSKEGIILRKALEKIMGSPALDEYPEDAPRKGEHVLSISRHRLRVDVLVMTE